MKKVGSVEITIRIMFDQNVSVAKARKFINELDYGIIDITGEVSIQDTEVVGDNLADN